MKAKMLKIAGVKSEKEFYKKYPTEEAFMKAHGKQFKKAMRASNLEKSQAGSSIPNADSMLGFLNTMGTTTGMPPQTSGRQLPTAREMYNQYTGGQPLANIPDINKMMKPVGVPAAATKTKGAVGGINPYVQAGSDVVRGIQRNPRGVS